MKLERLMGRDEFRNEVKKRLQEAILFWCTNIADIESASDCEAEMLERLLGLYVRIFNKDADLSETTVSVSPVEGAA